MIERPTVTVLVPSYNHGRFITTRIESILKQTYQNFELIVIDDHSTDNSHEVIERLSQTYNFIYLRNEKNSGTPFASWEKIISLAKGEYIWICESDDFAEPDFLGTAVTSLEQNKNAVLFYCNSWVVDESDLRVDDTTTYFHEVWRETRWDTDFVASGRQELLDFQLRGQIVPNMSSALIATAAFKSAFRPFLKKLKLTGDWLFVGDILHFGDAVFSHMRLSNFRRHEVTARVRVKSARSQAEFILTKYCLFTRTGEPFNQFAKLMSTDVIRFLYEPASAGEVLKALLQISWTKTFGCTILLLFSTIFNRKYLEKFRERQKHARALNNDTSN